MKCTGCCAEVGALRLKADIYFFRPYHSWEKGLIEQHNGLLWEAWPNFGSPRTWRNRWSEFHPHSAPCAHRVAVDTCGQRKIGQEWYSGSLSSTTVTGSTVSEWTFLMPRRLGSLNFDSP